jgi:phytoene dehydrogenase-like protein
MTSVPDLPESVDAVVIGAGHNGLVAAGYLAAAGLEVLVLEAGAAPGGDTITEELTLPGFAHDSCSSAHVLIQNNPLLRDDELGLLSRYGLEYIRTDPAVLMPQAHGDCLVMRPDLDATVDEIGRWSADDAQAFRQLMAEWSGGLGAVHGRWGSGLELGDSDAAQRYRALRQRSAWDVVHERFAHPVIRSFVLWMAMATIQDPRRPGTGFLPSSLSAGRIAFGWSTPVGGSGALAEALVRQIEAHGGRVACSSPVATVEADGGRAVAVRTADGRRVTARRAVVSGAHLARLAAMVTGVEPPADLVAAREQWQPGLSVFAVHAALRRDLRFPTPEGLLPSVAAGLGTTDGMVAQLDALYRGDADARDPWLLVVNQTVVDPGRAPDGGGTFKILTIAPYERRDGRDWAEAKHEYAAQLLALVAQHCEGLAEDDVLALRPESPVDVAGHNVHNLGGSCHGGEFRQPDGSVIPGWPTHRSGLPGLYLTGCTTHPGGSVSGRPGRNAARAVLADLGLDPGRVMGPS